MEPIRFGSVCSGIEAASVAWHPLGWQTVWLAEIEPFPSAVLAHHYPDTPNLGDMTTIARRILTGEVEAPDVFAGGTPCQAFSVAGLRKSLDDARGNLSLKFVELADAIDHVRARRGDAECVVFWENVPGVLSTPDNAFGCFLAGLAGEDEPLQPPGKRWANAGCVYGPRRAVAWRTLDAQYFGVAQRRRRVFVVASARNGFDPAQVLFEWEGVRRDSAPRRGQGSGSSIGTLGGTSPGGGWRFGADEAAAGQLIPQAFGGNKTSGPRDVASALSAHGGTGRHDFETETFITHAPDVAATMVARSSRGGGQTNSPGHNADEELVVTQFSSPVTQSEAAAALWETAHTLRGEGFDASEDGTGRGTPLVPVAFQGQGTNLELCGDVFGTLRTGADRASACAPCIAFDTTQITSATNRSQPKEGDPCHPLAAQAHTPAIAFDCKASGQNGFGIGEIASTQRAMGHANSHTNGGGHQAALVGAQVRRLMPEECEPLQGFPRGYTLIPWRGRPAAECPDGPRYKALGNSWAVPVAHWAGKRIDAQLKRLSA